MCVCGKKQKKTKKRTKKEKKENIKKKKKKKKKKKTKKKTARSGGQGSIRGLPLSRWEHQEGKGCMGRFPGVSTQRRPLPYLLNE